MLRLGGIRRGSTFSYTPIMMCSENRIFTSTCAISLVNQTGRWLIEKICRYQLLILNGRSLGDLIGQFTGHTPRVSIAVVIAISQLYS